MFRLIGNVSKKVYYESENDSDLNKWRLDNFLNDSQADGHLVSQYDAPEAMVIVKVKANKSRREYLNNLLDQGKFEEYRRITMENSSCDIEVYGSGKDKPELINRRKNVEKLFRQGITNTAEIASRLHISRSTVNFDLRVLRKTYPELRQRKARS
ncbi:helix-turn-helix transcriptional regulator [Pediococcus pentosaceus]|uniref:helix-turn-helix transcriptional regulator n=1 Tax=Pediococcus pentosaceus TaxID=1255 RepID=UPI0018FE9409|nr:helix-turn-helix transcriptional regulator [Pediococcus pentosaceus]MBF7131110.1 helix-turn-helix transcriptional regulator [Pediococcus pentosaceus]